MKKTKQIIEHVILVGILLLSALICLLLASKKKPLKKDNDRVVYDSIIKLGHDKIKQKQDTINLLHAKRNVIKKKINLRKSNINTLQNIDTVQTLTEYKDLTKDLEKVIDLGDSILIQKNDQLRIQDSMLYNAKVEIKRLDDTVSHYINENAKLKADIDKLNKKLNRRKKVNTIIFGTILTFGYLLVK